MFDISRTRLLELIDRDYRPGLDLGELYQRWSADDYYAIAFDDPQSGSTELPPTLVIPANELNTYTELREMFRRFGFGSVENVQGFWVIRKELVGGLLYRLGEAWSPDADQDEFETATRQVKAELAKVAHRTVTRPH